MNTIFLIFTLFNPRAQKAPLPPPSPPTAFDCWVKGYPQPGTEGEEEARKRKISIGTEGSEKIWTSAKKIRRSGSPSKEVKLVRRRSQIEREEAMEDEEDNYSFPVVNDFEILYKGNDPNDTWRYCVPKSPYQSSRTSSITSSSSSLAASSVDILPHLSRTERREKIRFTFIFLSLFILLLCLLKLYCS
ncbi:hypothetical protein BT69DRAFT_1276726 [Atractiella rhizophila]|nr:hypothetical protein BT69DRAFT_1276726 [Atractiella rhizophila]